MDTQSIRRQNLRRIIDERFDGTAGQLADYVKIPRPNISQVLSGIRPFGEKLARKLEIDLRLGEGALDSLGDTLNLTEEAAKMALDYMRLSTESQAKVRYYITVELEMEEMGARTRFSRARSTQ